MDNTEILLLEEPVIQGLTKEECEALKPIVKDFVKTYAENKDMSVDHWLTPKLQVYFPEKSPEEIRGMTEEIVDALKVSEEKKASLTKAVKRGRTKESWFASEVEKATSGMSMDGVKSYLQDLDNAVEKANQVFLKETIHTNAGTVNQSYNLDGFIAEQYHAQSFNLNAEAAGSPYRAKVLQPEGKGYSKNGVDLVIIDTRTGKNVKRYQAKYYKNAKATAEVFKKNHYPGQQKLVPSDQINDIDVKATDVIESPDGIKSNRLTKSQAEQMRDKAQSGDWENLNIGKCDIKHLAQGIGRQAGYAAVQGAVIGAGLDLAQKVWDGEEIKGEEVVETALKSGADFGVKSAAAGAIKVGVEKDIIKVIPKGTPLSTISNIAFVAVENIKVLGKVATGELTASEGLEKMGQTTVSATAGLVAMGKGAAIGVAVGTLLGPVGTAVGGFIGGSIGYMAGSKVGKVIFEGAKKIVKRGKEFIKNTLEGVKNLGSSILSGIRSLLSW